MGGTIRSPHSQAKIRVCHLQRNRGLLRRWVTWTSDLHRIEPDLVEGKANTAETLPKAIQTSAVDLLDQHQDPVMDLLGRMDMQSLHMMIEHTALSHHCETILPLLLEA